MISKASRKRKFTPCFIVTHTCSLAEAVDATKYLVADLKNFNGDKWQVRYPHFAQVEPTCSTKRPPLGRRTLTFADEPSSTTDVVVSTQTNARQQLKRSVTSAGSPTSESDSPLEAAGEGVSANEEFTILNLDLNLGATRHAKALISHLEKSSISSLLDNRLSAALSHLDLLHARVHDPHSRVLVTGDLNAGKSTLVNALLRRSEVMPTDQQPLTTRFVEVVSAKENNDKEEIHIIESPSTYNPQDPSTYTVASIDDLEKLATDPEIDSSAPPLRVFLREVANDANPSILHNGVVDISLIDAPGLNRDSIKTTANFARQEEIDVVVFVVSAANHFTLSAKEFIWQAGHEKAHLFIVVNRYDQIKDKERCRRAVMEQIKQLSPETYEDAKDLVHFVDSAKVALGYNPDDSDGDDVDETFSALEQSLRSFVLVNRAKSKLGPAQNYITHLLADVELLGSANAIVAKKEHDDAIAEVDRVKPELDRMKNSKDTLEDGLVGAEEAVTAKSTAQSQQSLRAALDRVGRGEPAIETAMPAYPGLLGAWDYASEVRKTLLTSLDVAVRQAEDETRQLTTVAVKQITDIGEKHLPSDVEKSKRVFNSAAMFHARKGRASSARPTVGLGLAGNAILSDVVVSDIFDLQHHLFLSDAAPADTSKSSPIRDLIPASMGKEVSGLGAASLALGAVTMAGGKTMALRTVFESAMYLSELASNPVVRKWAGPALGVVVAGAIAYVIYELPRSIPRNVGRHIRSTLLVTSGEIDDDEQTAFYDAEAQRISREVRKVMRLAAWDLRERFRAALDARGEIVRQSEETARQAARALEWFTDVEQRVDTIRGQLGLQL